jgi:O-antigen ligase
MTLFALADQMGSNVFTRFLNIKQAIESESSSAVRLVTWRYTISRTLESPLTGYALERFGNHPHNMIIEAFFATGIFGGLLYLLVMLKSLFCSFKLLRLQHSFSWIGVIFIHEFVRHLFSSSIWMGSSLFYATVGVLVLTHSLSLRTYKHGVSYAGI